MAISQEVYDKEYKARFREYYDELKWLYFELYHDSADMFEELCDEMYRWHRDRRDIGERPGREDENQLIGMMMCADMFAGDMEGVRRKLDYVQECNVNILHLTSLSAIPESWMMGEFAGLAQECHERGIRVCVDLSMNYAPEGHRWARKARRGDPEYRKRFYFYDNYDIPAQFEETMSQALPADAPGNFSWVPDVEKFVMTTFYPHQWDLNYRNPAVLNEMIYYMLGLADKGADIFCINEFPYLWKRIGTNCRNLPEVHSIIRILRIVCQIACPQAALLGKTDMMPDKASLYFGTAKKPEFHMLYHTSAMTAVWHSVATRDIRLLKHQMEMEASWPGKGVFLNYLRCNDSIGWDLDYFFLMQFGIGEVSHRKYLNEFFTGKYSGSFSRGELHNSGQPSGEARLDGTTASLCGIEKAAYEQDEEALGRAVCLDLMLHAYTMSRPGIPVIYNGDEIGQENDYTLSDEVRPPARACITGCPTGYTLSDEVRPPARACITGCPTGYTYRDNPGEPETYRPLHCGKFRWDKENMRNREGTVQQKIFEGLRRFEGIRREYSVFGGSAAARTTDTWDKSVLGFIRENEQEKLIALFNFSEQDRTAWINEDDGEYMELISGRTVPAKGVDIPAYGVCWLYRKFQKEEKD